MASIGVLVVDDSVVIRRMVASVLDDDPEIDVVGTAANGRIALDKLPQLRPDIVILDVEMPIMDGLETLRALRRTHPHLPVVMFSTLTERGASATLDALAAGSLSLALEHQAVDVATEPRLAFPAVAIGAAGAGLILEQLRHHLRIGDGPAAVLPLKLGARFGHCGRGK